MTKEQLAAQLTGRERLYEMTPEEEKQALENGLIVVFGCSDDCTEFRGVIEDELGSGLHEFTKDGVFKSEEDEEVLAKYGNPVTFNKILAIRNPVDEKRTVYASWGYSTLIPYATFDIMDDDELYCRGIVFSIKDLK